MQNFQYAPRRNRLLGQIMDGFVAPAPLVVGLVINTASEIVATPFVLIGAAFLLGYYFLADGLEGGQSIGKRWLGMRVVDEKTGEPCTYMQSFGRNLMIALLGPIDWIFIVGEKHQRLGDMIAGTIVIEVSESVASAVQ